VYIPHIHHTYHIHHIHHHRLYVHYEVQVSIPEFVWISISAMRLIVLLRADICHLLARRFHLCPLCVSLDLNCLQHVTHPYLQCLNHARSRKINTPSLPFVFSLIHPFVLPSSFPPHLFSYRYMSILLIIVIAATLPPLDLGSPCNTIKSTTPSLCILCYHIYHLVPTDWDVLSFVNVSTWVDFCQFATCSSILPVTSTLVTYM
jgi:hypothetical protein